MLLPAPAAAFPAPAPAHHCSCSPSASRSLLPAPRRHAPAPAHHCALPLCLPLAPASAPYIRTRFHIQRRPCSRSSWLIFLGYLLAIVFLPSNFAVGVAISFASSQIKM
ncbi:hypothetical protein B0H14DRAFT_3531803 [Mycena olivaceomarginata]|nr:hypothetical protein B0H14DRAFT_3531803 [Mycena olivaceomarginata]